MKRYEQGGINRVCLAEGGNLLAHLKVYGDSKISVSFDHYVLTAGEFDRVATWFARCNEETLPPPNDPENRSL